LWWNKKVNKASEHKNELANLKNQELNSNNLRKILGHSTDIHFQELLVNGNQHLLVTLLLVDGMVETALVTESILKPLTNRSIEARTAQELIKKIEQGGIYFAPQQTHTSLEGVLGAVLGGQVAVIFDQERTAITFDVRGFEKRRISEPTSENVIKGGKDAFVETLRMNTATLRRRINSTHLVIEETIVGQRSFHRLAIVYIKGLTNPDLVNELRERINHIDIDAICATGDVEERIIDRPYSPFPQILFTERPDKFCANIMEGRAGLLIDTFPTGFIVPANFAQFIQAPEDYSMNYAISSIVRLGRYLMFLVALLLPGYYVALTTFHQEMIPTDLAVAIAEAEQGVPFPSFMEVIIMLLAFEVLLEAGLRLPRAIGQAVSIVGAVVVGQAAVDARLVSPSVVIAIAITGIAGYTMPNQDLGNSLRLARLAMVILASLTGLPGIAIGVLLLIYHLASIETFGVPYLAPLVGNEGGKLQDTLFRFPLAMLQKRPAVLKPLDKQRQRRQS
jgi:spore germination protein KA